MTTPSQEPGRWLKQAREIAAKLKVQHFDKDPVKIGIAFEDHVAEFTIDKRTLETLEQAELVLCQFEDPEYVALRNQIAKQRQANDSQPAPAGPDF